MKHDPSMDDVLGSLARLKDLELSEEKREAMLRVIRARTENTVPRSINIEELVPSPIVSPWSGIFMRQRVFVYVTAALLIACVGTGTIFAAETALPGDALYGVKTNITERVRDAVAFSSVARALWDGRKIERRIEEAENLFVLGRLTPDLWTELGSSVERHSGSLESEIAKLERAGRDRDVFDIRSDMEGMFAAHVALSQKLEDGETLGFKDALHQKSQRANESRSAAEGRFLDETNPGNSKEKSERFDERFEEARRRIESSQASLNESTPAEVRAEIQSAQQALERAQAARDEDKANEAYKLLLEADRGAHKADIVNSRSKKLKIESSASSDKEETSTEAEDGKKK